MLRHFDQALRPPEPLRALHAPPPLASLPWHRNQHGDDTELVGVSSSSGHEIDSVSVDENDMRGLISRRLDNMSMRIRRVETLESLPEDASADSTSTTSQLLSRLKDMRGQIGGAVGIIEHQNPHDNYNEEASDAGGALRHELEAWNTLEERIGREIIHPGRLLTPAPQPTASGSSPIPIPIPPRKLAGTLSPPPSPYNNSHRLSRGSPESPRSYFVTPPGTSRTHSQRRNSSASSSSVSPTPTVRLEHCLRVRM